ncbi:MAG: recombinase family protein [Ruminococcus sp.]|jgi:site-specific DNA recombinase|nr:recombinase family protein [Ruminococcus sp.]
MNETGIYVRVSTEEQAQEGFSIRAQEQKLKDYARIKDWQIYKIYADEGISGKDIKGRPAVKELIADVESGKIKNVLVFKIDRLTRSTADLIYLVDTFNKYDCAFNSLLESIDTHTASGRMFLKIIGIFAEFERENIIERTRVGVERKVKEGYSLCTAQASYGYDRAIGERIQTINEEEAEIVREIFDMFVTGGETLTNIARLLNLRGVKTKADKTWDSSKIRRLLKNSNYIGNVRHHIDDPKRETHYDGLHEPILDEEIFIAANELLEKNTRTSITKPPDNEKYFSGFLVCAECGYKLKTYTTFKQLKTRKQKAIGYVCTNRTLKTCHASSMSHKKVEAAFTEYLSQIADFESPEEDITIEQKKQENAKNIAAYENKLKALEAKDKETLELYVSNELSFDEYRAMRTKIEADRAFINAEIERIKLPSDNESDFTKDDIILNLRENWELLTDSEKRTFLRNFVERIVIESTKDEGCYFGEVRVLEVKFTPFS